MDALELAAFSLQLFANGTVFGGSDPGGFQPGTFSGHIAVEFLQTGLAKLF